MLPITGKLFNEKTIKTNNLKASYEKLLKVFRNIAKENLLPYLSCKPKMNDL